MFTNRQKVGNQKTQSLSVQKSQIKLQRLGRRAKTVG